MRVINSTGTGGKWQVKEQDEEQDEEVMGSWKHESVTAL